MLASLSSATTFSICCPLTLDIVCLTESQNDLLVQIFAKDSYATGGEEAERLLVCKGDVVISALLLDLTGPPAGRRAPGDFTSLL